MKRIIDLSSNRAYMHIAKVLVSFVILGGLLWIMRDDLGKVYRILLNIRTELFFLSVVLFFMSIVIASWRLLVVLKGQGVRLNIHETLSLTLIGYFFNNFLPTSIGGDIVKAYYASRKMNDYAQGFTSIFFDRFIGTVSIFFIALVALMAGPMDMDPGIRRFVIAGLTVVVIMTVLLFNSRIHGRICYVEKDRKNRFVQRCLSVYNVAYRFKENRSLMAGAFFLAMLGQFTCFVAIYFAAASIGADISLFWIMLLIPIVIVITMLPSLGGLGLRESGVVFLLGPLIGRDNAFSVSLLWLVMLLLASMAGAVIYVFGTNYKSLLEPERMGSANVSKT